ncbi:MAG TPA: NYN domain-containing protein, partial [Thermomicrobiales bacterium]|nr:NYN domain-containing protein [Thermomicrobiales bacterium]
MIIDGNRAPDDGTKEHQAFHSSQQSPANADVALLIDWENLKYSLQNLFGVSANASSLMDAAGAYGRVVIARAYADWTQRQLTVDAVNLYRTGIEPVYVNAGEKNSADVRLAVDAVDLCMRMAHISTFVVVTGDKDLIHPINYIRLNGRRTVIIGVGATIAGRLVASVDEVLRYEEDLEPLVRSRATSLPGTQLDDSRQMLYEQIVAILAEYPDGHEMQFALLGNMLKARIEFNAVQQFGKSFKALMLDAQDAGIIAIRTEGLVDFASLPQAGAGVYAWGNAIAQP